ncbi:MAG: hypothetical protein ACQ9CV_00455 [Nitrosopumilus sp.]|jgi:hypothetical protein
MVVSLEKTIKDLKEIDEKIDKISKQWAVLKHEYRSSKDPILRSEIKEKWDKLQKNMKTLEKKRRGIIEKKNEIEFKNKWKGWK